MRKEFKEFEELQEFKNENVPKNAVIADNANNGSGRASTLHHSITPLLHHSTTPSLHFFADSCGVAARSGRSQNPTTANPSPQ